MRKALVGILMAATMATPVLAQSNDSDSAQTARQQRAAERYQRLEQRNQQRHAPREQRQAQPAQAQQPVYAAGRREDRQDRREERRENRQDRREQRDQAFRDQIEASRRASQASAAHQNDHYRRLAARNQRRYEERLREQRAERREDRREWRQDRRQDRRWNRDWRRDSRYDWQRHRFSNRTIFHIGPYYSPYRSHRYSRFSIGGFLNQGFFGQRYWISDPWQYRLPPAYAGTQWVRYYDDVLLVDLYTGEVIDVIYDFFW